MARVAYFDCFSGASGDMVLGALLDLGLPLDGLRTALGSLAIDHGEVAAERVLRAGISATKFFVREPAAFAPRPAPLHRFGHPGDPGHAHSHQHAADHGAHHTLKEIAEAIDRSALSAAGKAKAVRLFTRLGEAEAAIHDVPIDEVHLHEVGALDSIIDIVGAVHGMEWLAADQVLASPLNVGSGTIECAHGTFPVPAPATLRLLDSVPIYAGPVATELVTPTGALLLTAYADRFVPLPPMRAQAIGYGAGDRDFKGHPNVLRVIVGEIDDAPAVGVDRRARMRDRRHEPAALRPADGSAARGRRAGRVLRPGADEEEPAGHARHGAAHDPAIGSGWRRCSSPRRRRLASAIRRCGAIGWTARRGRSRRRSVRSASRSHRATGGC